MKRSCNRSSVSHTIRVPGFKYDIFKGELSKDSLVSKSEHPIPEVEEFKKKLLSRKIFKDAGAHLILKKNIRTGLLMAVNLHAGKLIKENPYTQEIVVSPEEAIKLNGKLPEKDISIIGSEIVMKSICDTLKFSSVNIMEVNEEVFINHKADTFGQDEAFVLKILQERGIVSLSARHGSSGKQEADIVDEINREQYEIVYEFKTALSKKRMKPDILYSPEILLLQLADNPFIHTSRSLEKKLKKQYNDRYHSNLVILTFGSKRSTTTMLEALSKKMEREQISELNFSKIYIISLDFVNEQAIFVKISSTEPFTLENFPCKNKELGFIKLTPIEFSSMKDTGKYLMVCDEIFDKTQRIRYDDGKALKKWVKDVHIWGVQKDLQLLI